MPFSNRYVLITAARDEEAFIRFALDSVVGQTVAPVRWLIVNDGSKDQTAEIIQEYCKKHTFIKLIQSDARSPRSFGSKALAINAGYEEIRHLDFDFVGNLDADISFGPNYYERLIGIFNDNQKLGTAGGVIWNRSNSKRIRSVSSLNHTPGAVQLFRRECFESIGGYPVLRTGGIDAAAELMVRMKGWETRSYPEIEVDHYRPEGSPGGTGLLVARFKQGKTDFNLGVLPPFEIVKAISRWKERPLVIGSIARLFGYLFSWIHGDKPELPKVAIEFGRQEQRDRLQLFSESKSLHRPEQES